MTAAVSDHGGGRGPARNSAISEGRESASVRLELNATAIRMKEKTPIAAAHHRESEADDAAGLIKALGHRKAHVFGTSLGSIIAQALAVRHSSVVDRLILSAAIRIGRSVADIAPETAAELGRLRANPGRNAMAIAHYFFTAGHLARHPELAERFAGSKRTPAQQARRNALIPGAPLLPLGGITAPTLVLAHAEDKLIPPTHSLGIANEIPGARTVVLDGLGHVGTIQAPERVAAVVRGFLS